MEDINNQPIDLPDDISGFIVDAYNLNLNKEETCVRIFLRGENFYTSIGNDAIILANILYGSSSCCKTYQHENKKIYYMSIGHNKYEKIIRDLLIYKRFTVELWKDTVKITPRFSILLQGSPGNLGGFQDLIYNFNTSFESNILIAFFLKSSDLGVKTFTLCFCDSLNNLLGVTEFQDTDSFSTLETLLVQINPYECILPKKSQYDCKKLEEHLKMHNILVSKLKYPERNEVMPFTNMASHMLPECASFLQKIHMENPDLYCILSVVLSFISVGDLVDKDMQTFNLFTFNHGDFMSLDASAISSLSIFPNNNCNAPQESTLYSLLNKCRTKQGQRLLSTWLRQPLYIKEQINNRLNMVEFFVKNSSVARELNSCLKSFPDISLLINKLTKTKATINDCVKLYFAMAKIPKILDILQDGDKLNSNEYNIINTVIITPLQGLVDDVLKYRTMIETLVNVEINVGEEFTIKPDVDEGLAEINCNIKNIESKMEKYVTKLASKLGLEAGKSLKQEYSNTRGYCLRVTLKESKCINEQHFKILESHKDGIYFVDDHFIKFNDELCQLQKEYRKLQIDFIKEMVQVAAGYIPTFQKINDIISHIDVILSFSELVMLSSGKYVKPNLLDSSTGRIIIKQGRHPCMEVASLNPFIPNDLKLVKGDCHFLIITGPNMGGKSTYLRQCAIIILMAQIGCFVPCEEAEISLIDKIITRIGAADYQLKGLSTFMAEMVDASTILRAADSNSLVIVDELGRGTSTYDGFGLAWSIAEHTAKVIQSYTLFATHFHEITSLEDTCSGVSNYHVEIKEEEDGPVMLYKIVPGFCESSYGLHVARVLSFPSEIIDNASGLLSMFESKVNSADKGAIEDENSYFEAVHSRIKQLPIDSLSPDELKSRLNEILTT